MSHVVSMRLRDDQIERLRKQARRLGRTPSETAALFVEEALRMAEFAYIEFRNSIVGRQAYMTDSSLAVWEVIVVARGHNWDVESTAKHLQWRPVKVQAALNYAAAFPAEIDAALKDNDISFEEMKRMLPGLEEFVVPYDTDDDIAPHPEHQGAVP
jgi:hypothetical protein